MARDKVTGFTAAELSAQLGFKIEDGEVLRSKLGEWRPENGLYSFYPNTRPLNTKTPGLTQMQEKNRDEP